MVEVAALATGHFDGLKPKIISLTKNKRAMYGIGKCSNCVLVWFIVDFISF